MQKTCIFVENNRTMLDQSFSYDTINTVFMQSNRKGQVKKEFLSAEYLEAAKEYRVMRHSINSLKKISKEIRTEEQETEILELEIKMKDNAIKQKDLLTKCLFKISEGINRRGFKFTLTSKQSDDPKKPNYLIGKTAEEFFDVFKNKQSDVVIMDLGLPGMNGLCATKILKDKYPSTKIIILTSHEQTDEVVAALACGANAYCLKDIDGAEIQNIIRSVHKGVMWIHPKVSEATRQSAPKPISTDFDNLYCNIARDTNLTDREVEVLKKIVDGKTNTEIANDMCISTHTAKAHVGNILSKLSVTDRVEAAVKAVRSKIVD